MPRTIHGDLAGHGLRVAVLVAQWNSAITDRLKRGALATLAKAGVAGKDVAVLETPGAFELPQAATRIAKSGRVDAVVALGCVVKGETPHNEHLARACAHGLMDAALESGIPVTFGVITADTMAQARARSGSKVGGKGGNKGVEAAEAAIRLANALRAWERSS